MQNPSILLAEVGSTIQSIEWENKEDTRMLLSTVVLKSQAVLPPRPPTPVWGSLTMSVDVLDYQNQEEGIATGI